MPENSELPVLLSKQEMHLWLTEIFADQLIGARSSAQRSSAPDGTTAGHLQAHDKVAAP
ncbi:hypothetical protein [Streptomyces sp. NBC_01190]|uniref:hypothetical protein n=1 Tax=Streptomyces sp. NBC_01190 TaxID=2903767 RepID=UPI00386AC55A|nr:hypothetical protein OG519_17700 [Streptomyces sp. NBC_01190]